MGLKAAKESKGHFFLRKNSAGKEQRAYSDAASHTKESNSQRTRATSHPQRMYPESIYRPQGRHEAGNSINKGAKMYKSGTSRPNGSCFRYQKKKKERKKKMSKLCSWLFQSALTGCFSFPNGRPEFQWGKKEDRKAVSNDEGGTIADS